MDTLNEGGSRTRALYLDGQSASEVGQLKHSCNDQEDWQQKQSVYISFIRKNIGRQTATRIHEQKA